MPVLIGSQNYFKMKKFRCFMQIAYSPNNALITVSCRLRGGCERLPRRRIRAGLRSGGFILRPAQNHEGGGLLLPRTRRTAYRRVGRRRNRDAHLHASRQGWEVTSNLAGPPLC